MVLGCPFHATLSKEFERMAAPFEAPKRRATRSNGAPPERLAGQLIDHVEMVRAVGRRHEDASGPEYAGELRGRPVRIGHVVEHVVGHHDVEGAVREGELLCVARSRIRTDRLVGSLYWRSRRYVASVPRLSRLAIRRSYGCCVSDRGAP
jgi:hypothetical protein